MVSPHPPSPDFTDAKRVDEAQVPNLLNAWRKEGVGAAIHHTSGALLLVQHGPITLRNTRGPELLPCFTDGNLSASAEQGPLLSGSFHVDLETRSIARLTSSPRMGDSVAQGIDPRPLITVQGTSFDLLTAFLDQNFSLWQGVMSTAGVKGSELKFEKELPLDHLLKRR